MSEVRVRFAPSPTGFFHIGSARTALFNWLYAKHTGGKFVLRIEDTDKQRNTQSALNLLLEGMNWLGLDWDEGPKKDGNYGPYFQSQRNSIYHDYLNILKEKNRVYEKEGALWFKLNGERYIEYDSFHKREIEKVKNQPTLINDLIRGPVERIEEKDFIIFRSNGEPVFHFVNVVDDITMQISHVIRGEDHLSNTSKHIELYRAFDAKIPEFAHIPLILKETGPGKMSKRDKGALIENYKERYFSSSALRNYISLLGWNPKDNKEIMPIETIIKKFSFEGINKGNARFDETKLFVMNSKYIKEMSLESLSEFVLPKLKVDGLIIESSNKGYFLNVLKLCKDKINSIENLSSYIDYFFSESFDYDKKGMDKIFKNENICTIIEELIVTLSKISNFESCVIDKELTIYAEKNGCKIFTFSL